MNLRPKWKLSAKWQQRMDLLHIQPIWDFPGPEPPKPVWLRDCLPCRNAAVSSPLWSLWLIRCRFAESFHFGLRFKGYVNKINHFLYTNNPLQCSCLENPRDGGAWWAFIYGVAQSRTRLKRLSSSSRHCFTWWLHQFTSPQEWKGFPFIHIFSNTYLCVRFFNDHHYVTISFCNSARSYLIVVLFCMSIMIREVGNLFTDLLAICLSSLEKCLCKSSIFN